MSHRVWIRWIAAVTLTILPAVAAHATEGVVVGDTYVNSAHPAVNYGSLSNLYVNSTGTALIQFDLSSLPSGTTSSQISAAYLKVYVNRINTSGLVNIQPVTSTWSESAVTYTSIPSLGTAAASFTPATAQQFVVVDITSLVQSWVTTPASNYGIALTTTTGDAVFDSKENDETSHATHLDITVVSQGPAGAAGTAATVTVGTTTTGTAGSNASVTNSGTSSAAVLNFTVPAGATGPTGPTGPAGAAGADGSGTFFSAQILVTPAILAYSSAAIGSSNTMLASPSFNGDPTFGETLPPLYLYTSMFMPTACAFDSLAINVSSLYNQPIGPGTGPITVTLMAQPPESDTLTGPSATITEEDFIVFALTATGTGSMAAPAGSYVWLQISGSGLTAFPTPGGVDNNATGVIGVVSHCS